VNDYSKWDVKGLHKRKQRLSTLKNDHIEMADDAKRLWVYHSRRSKDIERDIIRIEREIKRKAIAP
jgi:hypothetical protein